MISLQWAKSRRVLSIILTGKSSLCLRLTSLIGNAWHGPAEAAALAVKAACLALSPTAARNQASGGPAQASGGPAVIQDSPLQIWPIAMHHIYGKSSYSPVSARPARGWLTPVCQSPDRQLLDRWPPALAYRWCGA